MKPTFSIIIPCYKVEPYIRACLDSILAQTVNDSRSAAYAFDCWEAICTDDGSPDDTGKILEEYAARDPRIKVIHQENAGLSAARNAAMALASGEWFLYLDSDDLLSPWALETYLGMIKRHPNADIVKGGINYFNDGEKVNWQRDDAPEKVYDLSQEIKSEPLGGYFQQMIVKRSVFGDIPFVGLSWCEERPYVAKCVVRCREMVVGGSQCYGFRRRVGSITHGKMSLKQWESCLDVTHEVIDSYLKSGKKVGRQICRTFVNLMLEGHLDMIYVLLDRHDRRAAWKGWFNQLPKIAMSYPKTKWQSFVVITCRVMPFRPVALLLCYVPHWLKSKGIHR